MLKGRLGALWEGWVDGRRASIRAWEEEEREAMVEMEEVWPGGSMCSRWAGEWLVLKSFLERDGSLFLLGWSSRWLVEGSQM